MSKIIVSNILAGIIVLLLISGVVSAAKKEVTLYIGDSVVVEDRNITLVAANRDSFILCMNGQKIVIANDKYVEGVLFDIRQKGINYSRFQIKVQETDRACGGECSNQACLESFTFGCRQDKDCSEDGCVIGECKSGRCVYREDKACIAAGETTTTIKTTTSTLPAVPAVPAANEISASTSTTLNSITGGVVEERYSSEQLRRATFILLGFLVLLGLLVLIFGGRKRRDEEALQERRENLEKQKYY